jgi:chitodextrinase
MKIAKKQVLLILFGLMGLMQGMKASDSDTIYFDLENAVYTLESGAYYIEVPIELHTTDMTVSAVDFWFQFDLTKLTYVSTTAVAGSFDVFSNYNQNNMYLSNSSSTATIDTYLPTYEVIMKLKFRLADACTAVFSDDFYSINALLNGILSVGYFHAEPGTNSIVFDNSNTYCAETQVFFSFADSIGGGSIVQYNWDFGDASTSTGQSVSHVYGTEGNYTITLEVTNQAGCVYTFTDAVVVNAMPQVSFNANYNAGTNEVTFENTSTISSGSIVTYNWDFGDLSTSSEINPVHTYATEGFYNVLLEATSDLGCQSSFNATIDATNGISETDKNGLIVLYPNPADLSLTIECPVTGFYKIVSSNGAILIDNLFMVIGQQKSLETSAWANGHYFVSAMDDSFVLPKAILIQH